VAKAKAAGVHLILGPDPCLAEEALEELLTAAVGKGREHSVEVLRGDETTWARILEVAGTGSLFAERRAVVVRNAGALKGEGDEVLRNLVRYLDGPTPELSLIVMAAKADRRKGVWKTLADRADVRSAEPLKGRQLRMHVTARVKARGLRLTEDGLSELLDRVGADLQRLMGELEKLEAFADGRREPLGAGEVSSVLGRGLGRPLYKLGDAMAARRPAEALQLMQEMLGDGEPALLVLSALHRALRTARGVGALAGQRMPRDQVAARLRVPPWKLDELITSARRWPEEDLRAALRALDLADRRIKTGAEPLSALSAAVTEACRGGGPVRNP
jgi:DNA polymerase III subunit delta